MGSFLRMIWRASVRFGFRRLYQELAWAYDFVSRMVSRGQWRQWQRAALPHLRAPLVLDLGCGTGDLLQDLAEEGLRSIGLDASAAMLRVSRRKIQTMGADERISLIRARAQALPLLDGRLNSVVATFPSRFILDTASQAEIRRVLAPGGRLVIVDGGRLIETDAWTWLLNRAFDLTGGRGIKRSGEEAFKELGFPLGHRPVSLETSTVRISLGEKPEG
ncbi:MAG: class I SAM-dependent methyltransferase [Anaerolineae bacterium]